MIVTVVGTGYVGLVTGACLASRGHIVRCVDVSEERLAAIRAGRSPFYEPGLDDLLRQGQAKGALTCTTDLAAAVRDSYVSIVAVGTPPRGEEADLSYLETAVAQIGAALPDVGNYHVVCVKSTVVPGTTRTVAGRILERASGMRVGQFGLCMNPEFLREGSAVADFLGADRIVIGQADGRSGDVVDMLYESFHCPKLRVTLEEAELTKYASNSLLSALISFSNEMTALCEATPGVDAENVMEALHLDRRLSPAVNGSRLRPEILSYLRGGIGFGGSCLPKDVNALRDYARRAGVATPMLDAIMAVNAGRPAQVVRIAEAALGGLNGKEIGLLGVAFKAGTDDLRSSPAVALLEALRARGAKVRAYDPRISPDGPAANGLRGICRESLEAALAGVDAAVITTADPAFRNADWARLTAGMRSAVLIDGRNVLRGAQLPATARYYPIGRGGRFFEAARMVY